MKFSDNVRLILSTAKMEAHILRSDYVGSEHIMLGILNQKENTACRILKVLGIPPAELRSRIFDAIKKKSGKSKGSNEGSLSARAYRIMEIAFSTASALEKQIAGSEHLLLALIRETSGTASKILREDYRVNFSMVVNEFYGTGDLNLSTNAALRREAEEAIEELWVELNSEKVRETLVSNKVREIVSLLEYAGDQLEGMGKLGLREKAAALKKEVQSLAEADNDGRTDDEEQSKNLADSLKMEGIKKKIIQSKSRSNDADTEKNDGETINFTLSVNRTALKKIVSEALAESTNHLA